MRTWEMGFTGNLVVSGTASWFGGDDDPDDNGETASGINTKGNPDLMACALPFAFSNGHLVPSCVGSPFPSLPYKSTMVKVTANGKSIIIPVIDCGPALSTNRPIDLTQAAFKALGGDLEKGLLPVSYQVLTEGYSM